MTESEIRTKTMENINDQLSNVKKMLAAELVSPGEGISKATQVEWMSAVASMLAVIAMRSTIMEGRSR